MKLLLTLCSIVALAGCDAPTDDPLISAAEARTPAPSGSPTVVELYQSQGCSSCPPAIVNVNALAGRRDVLPLMFAVTYWDRLGWKDTFGDPAYTQRQWDYARHAGRLRVFTPQVVVNDGAILVGDVKAQVERAVAGAKPFATGPAIAATNGRVSIGAGSTPRPLTVWLVRYDPRPQAVAIRAGENSGRTLVHRNVVRQLVDMGEWKGKPLTLTAPPTADRAYRSAVLLQEPNGGPIWAARRV